MDSTTGLITWTPTAAELGNHEVVVHVSDGRGGSSEQRYMLIDGEGTIKGSVSDLTARNASIAVSGFLTADNYYSL